MEDPGYLFYVGQLANSSRISKNFATMSNTLARSRREAIDTIASNNHIREHIFAGLDLDNEMQDWL